MDDLEGLPADPKEAFLTALSCAPELPTFLLQASVDELEARVYQLASEELESEGQRRKEIVRRGNALLRMRQAYRMVVCRRKHELDFDFEKARNDAARRYASTICKIWEEVEGGGLSPAAYSSVTAIMEEAAGRHDVSRQAVSDALRKGGYTGSGDSTEMRLAYLLEFCELICVMDNAVSEN